MNKRIKTLICLTIIIVLLLCTKNLFKNNSYVEDLKYFFNVCEENYPYYELVREDINQNDYINKAKKCKTDDEFLKLLSDVTNEFNDVGHMRVFNAWIYYYFYISYNQAVEKGLIDKDDPNFLIVSNAKKYYDKYDNDKTYFKVKQEYNRASSNLEKNIFCYDMEGIPIVTIRSFAEEYRKNDIAYIDKFLSKYNGNSIVFDIRDNGGGSDYYWHDLVSLTKYKNYEYDGKSYGIGDKSYEYVDRVIENGHIKKLNNNRFMVTNHNVMKSKNKYNFEKIYMIVNDKNYSASEGFARFAKEHGYATLIGQPTKGSGGGVSLNPMILELPNTHFIFQMDAIKSEQFNTEPDIYMSTNQSNFDFEKLMKLIKG